MADSSGAGLRAFPVQPTVAVADLPRAREFYERMLGLQVLEESEAGFRYACGGDTTPFLYARAEHTPPGQRWPSST